jgi:hypothetical protein
MPEASCLTVVRTTWMCVVGSIILFLGVETRADDPAGRFDLPAPSTETEGSASTYDDNPVLSREATAGKTELEAAKLHVRNQPLNRVNASIKPPDGDVPHQLVLDDLVFPNGLFPADQSRPWAFNNYEWEAPATRHLPLLFEEPNLERLGYAYGLCDIGICEEEPRRGERLQALVSGVNFFGRIPFIPYMAGVRPVTEPVYAFGADRPGSPVPYRKYLPHWSLRGAAYQAGAAVGAVYIIP